MGATIGAGRPLVKYTEMTAISISFAYGTAPPALLRRGRRGRAHDPRGGATRHPAAAAEPADPRAGDRARHGAVPAPSEGRRAHRRRSPVSRRSAPHPRATCRRWKRGWRGVAKGLGRHAVRGIHQFRRGARVHARDAARMAGELYPDIEPACSPSTMPPRSPRPSSRAGCTAGSFACPWRVPPGVRLETLLVEPVVLAVPIDHRARTRRAARRGAVAPRDLRRRESDPRAAPRRTGALCQPASLCCGAGARPNVVAEVERMMTSLNLVAAGAGITVVPASMQGAHPHAIAYRPFRSGAKLAPRSPSYRGKARRTRRSPPSPPWRVRSRSAGAAPASRAAAPRCLAGEPCIACRAAWSRCSRWALRPFCDGAGRSPVERAPSHPGRVSAGRGQRLRWRGRWRNAWRATWTFR